MMRSVRSMMSGAAVPMLDRDVPPQVFREVRACSI
jgi:hypothetical protein